MAERVGVALLSFAHGHQQAWARSLQRHPNARIAAVWDDDPRRGVQQAERLGVPFIPELDAVLGRGDVDAVTICAENVQHANLAVAAARAGKHIMMQKPMATTVADCDRIVAAVEAAGVKYMQSFNLRFDPLHEAVKAVVDSGSLGRVNIVRRRHSHHLAIDPADRQRVLWWMADPARSGGGALMDEGAHAALWFVWMFGVPASVTAEVETRTPGLAVEDNAVLLYRWRDGLLGVHQTSWTEVAGENTIEVFGERGSLVATGTDIASTRCLPRGTPPLRVWTAEQGAWTQPAVELVQGRSDLVAGPFIDCIVRDEPSPVPAAWGRAAVEMVLAGYGSARDGRRVELPLPCG